MPSLRVTELTKTFGGLRAVDRCSFDVEPGTAVGLIGPNGSGKTTIFNLIVNLLRPDEAVWDESVQAEYDPSTTRLAIGPTATRGRYDAGLILQRGTGPIANAPFGPIAAWAESKGLPARPVWYKIKTKGVAAHPWLEDVLSDGRTGVAIRK